jgi:hypothetical protein
MKMVWSRKLGWWNSHFKLVFLLSILVVEVINTAKTRKIKYNKFW